MESGVLIKPDITIAVPHTVVTMITPFYIRGGNERATKRERVKVMIRKPRISPFYTSNLTRLPENFSSSSSRLMNLSMSSVASNRSS